MAKRKTAAARPSKAALEAVFARHGVRDFRWIDPAQIVVANWVRLKCAFGCGEYGANGCCPPAVPSVPECREFFREYRRAAVFRFEKKFGKPGDRHAWTRDVNRGLLKLEREVFLAGCEKAFLLFMDTCTLCPECGGSRAACKQPRNVRPTPEAMAVDVFSTVRKIGFPIEVLPDTGRTMNRYAFLMVD
jgi:predicted metal-binding protein